jgi:hypothetical protein
LGLDLQVDDFVYILFIQFLIDSELYESKDEAAKREEVLGRIDQVINLYPSHL